MMPPPTMTGWSMRTRAITGIAKPLSGRRALVTGGSRGIGAEIVRRLASDGAAVTFTYGASAAEAEKLAAEVNGKGARAVAVRADNTDPDQVAATGSVFRRRRHRRDLDVSVPGAIHIGSTPRWR